MDTHADVLLTSGDTSQNTLAESSTTVHEHGDGDAALHKDELPLDGFEAFPVDARSVLRTDVNGVSVDARRYPIRPFESEQKSLEIRMGRTVIDHEHHHTNPQNSFDEVFLPVVSEDAPLFDSAEASMREFTPPKINDELDVGDMEARPIVCPHESTLLRAGTTSSHKGREADSDNDFNCTWMLNAGMDNSGLTPLSDKENREELEYVCEDFPSSLPPSSSPPHLLSSSPCASSQSSIRSVKSSEMMMAADLVGLASSQVLPQCDHAEFVTQDGSRLESEIHVTTEDTAEVETVLETDRDCSQMNPPSTEAEPSPRKRPTPQSDPDELHETQSIKRPKLDPCIFPPPVPKHPTLAFQHRQFKKLTAPFRPPSKLSTTTDRPARTMNDRGAKTTIRTTPETNREKISSKGPTAHPLPAQSRALNVSKSVTQFKSPLVNRVLPADARTIRLTPELQALERKLQLLKRAIKVKEEKEEEVLTRLATKWIEAGREAAYDVWDATKDAGDFERRVALTRGPYGWESRDCGNASWGWDNRLDDANEESRDLDSSVVLYTAGRTASEENDEEVRCRTLGTMLHELGIAPEIFGWDDDKESFTD